MYSIAVVIPCYNSSLTLGETLESLLSQTRACDEVIVVDDGSQDNTKEIIKRFKHYIKYIWQENSGVGAARNKGVKSAISDWIAFCDADDVWLPGKLEIISQCLRKLPGINFIFHDFYIFDSMGITSEAATESDHTIFPIFRENDITMPEILTHNLRLDLTGTVCQRQSVDAYYGVAFPWLALGNFILPSSVIIRKDTFLNEEGFDISFQSAEETEFFLRISKSNRMLYIDLPLTGYRKSHGSLSRKTEMLSKNAMRALFKNCVEDTVVYEKYRKQIHRGISRRYCRLSYYYLSELKCTEAIKNAAASLKYDPFYKKAWFFLLASLLPKYLLRNVKDYKIRQKGKAIISVDRNIQNNHKKELIR